MTLSCTVRYFAYFGAACFLLAEAPALSAQAPPALPRVRVPGIELATTNLQQSGFRPASINRVAASLLLLVHNQSTLPQVAFTVERLRAGQRTVVPVRTKVRSRLQLLELPPGSYIMTAVSNPTWVCRINVRSQ